jgi:hypothetical protein
MEEDINMLTIRMTTKDPSNMSILEEGRLEAREEQEGTGWVRGT